MTSSARRDGDAAERVRVALQRRRDRRAMPVLERAALLDRLLDQLLDQMRRRAMIRPMLAVGRTASTALRIAASSVGSRSSRYIATCASVTRRRSGRTRPYDDERREDERARRSGT